MTSRRLRHPGRQGREHPPGLLVRLAAVPKVGRCRWLPDTAHHPHVVALYLDHLAAADRSMASIELARAAISYFHAAAGMQKAGNPARHPVVAKAMKDWRNRAPAPRQADALIADALARVREVLRLPRRGRGRTDGITGDRPAPRRPGHGNNGSHGQRRAQALLGRGPDLEGRGAVARRHRPDHGPEGQEPARPPDGRST